jgi:hypothetical protein
MYGNEPLTRKTQRTPSVRLRFGKRDSSFLQNEVRKEAETNYEFMLHKYLIFEATFLQVSCDNFFFIIVYSTLLYVFEENLLCNVDKNFKLVTDQLPLPLLFSVFIC